jgi:hypothetical protein
MIELRSKSRGRVVKREGAGVGETVVDAAGGGSSQRMVETG